MNIDELIERWRPEVECERVPGGLLITTWNGELLSCPIKLHLTERQLADQIRDNAENGIGAFDDSPSPSTDTGWTFLFLQLYEALDARDPEQVDFRLAEDGFVAM